MAKKTRGRRQQQRRRPPQGRALPSVSPANRSAAGAAPAPVEAEEAELEELDEAGAELEDEDADGEDDAVAEPVTRPAAVAPRGAGPRVARPAGQVAPAPTGPRRAGRLEPGQRRPQRAARPGSTAAVFEPLDPEDDAIPFDRVPYVPGDLRRVAVIGGLMVVLIVIAALVVTNVVK